MDIPNGIKRPTPAPNKNRVNNMIGREERNCGKIPPRTYISKPINMMDRFCMKVASQLVRNEKGIIIKEGAVNSSLMLVSLASGKACAIKPSAGEMAAPAMTVAIEIEIIVGFN